MSRLKKCLHTRLWFGETVRSVASQMAMIIFLSLLAALVWNRYVSKERMPLIRREVPPSITPMPTNSNGFVDPSAIPEAKSYEIIDVTQAYKMYQEGSATFIDARLKEEYEVGHIPGAILLPSEQFDLYYPEVQGTLPLERPLIVYCLGSDCELSVELCLFLLDAGHKKLYMYKGGWPEWQKLGLPEEKSTTTPDEK